MTASYGEITGIFATLILFRRSHSHFATQTRRDQLTLFR
jgi:hypothetical protein